MTKWLIRTHTNHLLGPISKAKLQELIAQNSLSSRDEVCSGNGDWFFLEESDMVDRFINGDEQQSFNPLSEHQVEDTQTGFFSIQNIAFPKTNPVTAGGPAMGLQAESPLEHHLPQEEKRAGLIHNLGNESALAGDLTEKLPTEKSERFLDAKTLLFVVLIALSASAYLLRDKIIEFKQDLKFFENTSSYNVFPAVYAQSPTKVNVLRPKKK